MGIGMIDIITACRLAKRVFELPDLLVMVNEIIRFCREHGLVLDETNLDSFNSVYWPALFSIYDCKLLNSSADTDCAVAFMKYKNTIGIAFGNMFYSI